MTINFMTRNTEIQGTITASCSPPCCASVNSLESCSQLMSAHWQPLRTQRRKKWSHRRTFSSTGPSWFWPMRVGDKENTWLLWCTTFCWMQPSILHGKHSIPHPKCGETPSSSHLAPTGSYALSTPLPIQTHTMGYVLTLLGLLIGSLGMFLFS